jgi:arylsulfatase A-like enzyme
MMMQNLLSRFGTSVGRGLAGICFAALMVVRINAAQPNFLVLFADDHCFEVLRSQGDAGVETPHLDRLASRGTTFTHAYNMGSWAPAVCVASRTMLMTGRSLWPAKTVHATLEREREAGRLWPQLLAAAGYRTYMSGKWHLPVDAARTFQRTDHIRPGMPKDTPAGYSRPLEGHPNPWNPTDPKFGGYWTGGRHWTEVTADDTVGFLREAGERPEPFFIYCAFNAPHDPRQAPRDYLDRYPAENMRVPLNFLPTYPHAVAMGAAADLRDERLAPFPRSRAAIQTQRREYYALITHLDAQIGRILAALDRSGRADNTWIVFTADHGLAVGQHGLMGKQNMYDHSLRVPFIVVGPGVEAGRRRSTPIHLQDVMPTTLELAGVARPDHVFFRSVLPLLRDPSHPGFYPILYGAYLDRQRAVVYENHKLILYPAGRVARLFDLQTDPHEMNDLSGDPRHGALLRRLYRRLVDRQRELGDSLDLAAVYGDSGPGTAR